MAPHFPYTRYACPCTESSSTPGYLGNPEDALAGSDIDEADEQTFDPSSPRANYALYPLESLLFCNECHEIRCPRCYYEEVLYYSCPSCLFETQSSVVKGETNRCNRSCFQCPICIAPLSISPYPSTGNGNPHAQEPAAPREGPFILSCQWCSWTSLEINVILEKPNNITSQLAKLPKSGGTQDASRDGAPTNQQDPHRSSDLSEWAGTSRVQRPTDQYLQLANFYKNQISETNPSGPFALSHNFGLDSPSQLSRLLSTYGHGGLRKQKDQPTLMREALNRSEGFRPELEHDSDDIIISRMQELGWDGMTSTEQRSNQVNEVRFFEDLRPIATKLRSTRSKRCRTCRHNLVKLDEKRQRWKHQIKLIALNFIPNIALRPLDHSTNLDLLRPQKIVSILLTFHNPLFDSVKVTLATSATTPGMVASKVTILCPQFEIGANTDVWDDALDTTNVERRRAMEALEGAQAEAGKIWEKGRNWTSIIVEVVPGTPQSISRPARSLETDEATEDDEPAQEPVLEIPLFVRLEYETEDASGDAAVGDESQTKAGKEKKVKRELAYWSVLGVGKIGPLAG